MCWNKDMHDKLILRKQNLSLLHQVWDILIIILSLFIWYSFVFIQPLSVFLLTIKWLQSHIASIPAYIYPTIIKSISK